MLRPTDSPERQIEKLTRINEALITRLDRSSTIGSSAYSLFQTATALEKEVHDRTHDLHAALADLSLKNRELALAHANAERARQNLVNAIEAMQEGFALFSNGALVICNRRFRNLLTDVSHRIEPGIAFDRYAALVSTSQELELAEGQTAEDWYNFRIAQSRRPKATFTVALKGDRWLQVSERQTLGGGLAILHTDVTDMVRQQRREQEKIIDAQANLARVTFEHLIQGLSTFNSDGDLVSCNNRFRDLVPLPYALTRSGVGIDNIIDYLVGHEIFQHPWGEQDDWIHGLRFRTPMRVELHRNDGVILDASFQRLPENGFIAMFTDVTAEREVTKALQQAKDTLEARVEERTAALTRANEELTREIRERQAFEFALREAKETAEAANLSKNRFLRAASHDLLQPMSAAKLFLSTLQSSGLDEGQADVAQRLGRAFMSMEALLHALLDISRLDTGKEEFNWANVPLSRILDPLRDEFQELATGYAQSLRVVPSSLTVRSDPTYLRRIAQNLVSNAIKYSEHGRVLVGVRRRGGKAVLEVWDTGPGIAPDDQERIFEEFHRLGDAGGKPGMGLGLSIVQRACAQLGHALSLSSEVGRGSVFRVSLDLAEDRPSLSASPPMEPTGSFGPMQNVIGLVVENDPEVRAAMTVLMESWGMGALDVGSTQEAVDLIREIDVTPDIVIADFQLDGADTGLDSIAALRTMTGQNLPALLVTADRSRSLRRGAAELGVKVLSKPVSPWRLMAAIRALTRSGT
ncbi:PAS-domain containing protein [Polymorphum gilvum]|uniref:histidine kinase n=1 Tax=Polymorphum gilvum (strain LMG 25793 / CGMCC 1.9160 / SL003B-26A1) TaxID=991905 RepID=F2IXV3_POLGS|nr:PAS-domain containing protein [Polymorphum gilvum]ADZ69434.1 Histidine kinase, putative [Polymorphum gilvum SL003B-26A1]